MPSWPTVASRPSRWLPRYWISASLNTLMRFSCWPVILMVIPTRTTARRGVIRWTDLAVGVPGEDIGIIVEGTPANVVDGAPGGLTGTGSQLFTQDSPGNAGRLRPAARNRTTCLAVPIGSGASIAVLAAPEGRANGAIADSASATSLRSQANEAGDEHEEEEQTAQQQQQSQIEVPRRRRLTAVALIHRNLLQPTRLAVLKAGARLRSRPGAVVVGRRCWSTARCPPAVGPLDCRLP